MGVFTANNRKKYQKTWHFGHAMHAGHVFFIFSAIIAAVFNFGGTSLVVNARVSAPHVPVIHIDSVNGMASQDIGVSCSQNPLYNPISISGSGYGSSPPGQIDQYAVQVDWGDGVVEDGLGSFDPIAGHGNFTFSFTAGPHAYPSAGAYTLKVLLYHTQPPGSDNQAEITISILVCEEPDTPPVITLVGDNPLELTVGDTFEEPGYTAGDAEDGDLTSEVVVSGDSVDTNTVGMYVITYSVTDSDSNTVEESRTVNINPLPTESTECNDEIDNDGDGDIDLDDSGCENAEDDDENTPPVITLVGDSEINLTVGDTYTEDGATADDVEDGDISDNIVVGGDTVDPDIEGTYVITYNVTDSDGAAADEVNRTVNVNSEFTECSDGIDNDGDGLVDLDDTGCSDEDDDSENVPPTILLLGDNPLELTVGDTFEEPGATAFDAEDGDLTDDIIIGGDTVDTDNPGTYTITYNVTDSDGADADEVTRTVNVNPLPTESTECNDEIDNDGDGDIDLDDSGCENAEDNDENTPPIITLNGSSNINLTTGDTYTEEGATADDVEDGDLTDDIIIGGDSVDTSNSGTYIVTYNVTDSDGADADEVVRTVNVSDPEQPQPTGGSGGGGGGGGTVISGPLSVGFQAPGGGQVLGTVTFTPEPEDQCEQYLFGFIKEGQENDPGEVRKLQTFLRIFEGFEDVEVNGVYDEMTQDAVDVFQERYFDDVLAPWGHDKATSYVYLTTRKKINEIYCRGGIAFPLTVTQEEEVQEFRALLESFQNQSVEGAGDSQETGIDGLDMEDFIRDSVGGSIDADTGEYTVEDDADQLQAAVGGVRDSEDKQRGILRGVVNTVTDLFVKIRSVF